MGEEPRSSVDCVLHRGREIMRLDYTTVSAPALPPLLDTWLVRIQARPLASVRAMVLPNKTFVASADAIKIFGQRATPYVLALALVTPDPFHRAFLWSMAGKGPRHIAALDDENAARDWLAAVDG